MNFLRQKYISDQEYPNRATIFIIDSNHFNQERKCLATKIGPSFVGLAKAWWNDVG